MRVFSSFSGTDGPEHVVSIWDVKYGTLQAERSLQLGDKTAYGKDKCVYSVRISLISHSRVDGKLY